MKRREIEALAERLLARSTSKLSCDQPELQRHLKMAVVEPRANWTEGDTANETTMDDSGISTTSKYGKALCATTMIVLNESTFDLLRMGEAKRFLPLERLSLV